MSINLEQQFTIQYSSQSYDVAVHAVGKTTVYRISFPDGRKPLVITSATDSNYRNFWTSVPQGRQPEAEEFGKLIDIHLNK